jgi:signal transduction histidine kinase
MRKILRISKQNRITSLADFVASRYGKSAAIGGLVTVIAVIGILPYISLQLKAISTSYAILVQYPAITMPQPEGALRIFFNDTAFWIALILAAFTIAFGTRHLDAAEHHQGMVAAIAFESLVKLLAFLAVGVFVTFGLYNGVGDIFARAAADPKLAAMLTPLDGVAGGYASWVWLTILSMMAIMFLPRQFQVTVIENLDERHLGKAIWLFPLYMLAINVFVLPIAFGGLMHLPQGVDADTFVLTLPMAEKQELLALLVFIGGLSAATGMVIVETIALSTMVCNDLVMPVLLRMRRLQLNAQPDLTGLLLGIRRGAIVMILLLGYLYFKVAGEAYALVSIGLVSFAAVAQFAPVVLGGIFWKGGTRRGAIAGLTAGFAIWAYTLLLPAFARSGWLPLGLLEHGPFGIELLKPLALFGLSGLDQITHAMIWSMLANIGAYVAVSLSASPSAEEHRQASLFVDVFRQSAQAGGGARFWRGTASVPGLYNVLSRFLGSAAADESFREYAASKGLRWPQDRLAADAGLVHHAERQLAGAIGAASARVMIASVVKEEALSVEEVRAILDEASQVVVYSHRLEQKSRELEAATAELRQANERLTELDRLKDDFVSTITHELRTPLTSIRAFTQILLENPDVVPEQRARFLGIITKETERLTRLINQVLDLSRIESGRAEWHESAVDMREVVADTVAGMSQVFQERNIRVELRLQQGVRSVKADVDRMIQVMLNLLSNAAKFCQGRIEIALSEQAGAVRVDVRDNGPGIDPSDHHVVFDKFRQGRDQAGAKGSGLGLHISRQIVEHFGGRMWVESAPGQGACFSFTLPT